MRYISFCVKIIYSMLVQFARFLNFEAFFFFPTLLAFS